MFRHIVLSSFFVGSLISLTACETVKDELGLSRHTPDEFMVMKRAPLEVPQDLSHLPQPQPGVQRPQEMPALAQAKQAVIGQESVTIADQASGAEQHLLMKAGAQNSSENIRALVNKEAAEQTDTKTPVMKKLLNIGKDQPAATIVDPVKEAERIQNNRQSGTPITAGETPTIND
ncbi:MAG: DUF3035 domain-containing protein [Pseudobdellovibrionaceae bacterium]|jgi:hypothetical protein|nr:DUF3035 domain-containing protein [Pseudobdellovibrionaceae bacterium]